MDCKYAITFPGVGIGCGYGVDPATICWANVCRCSDRNCPLMAREKEKRAAEEKRDKAAYNGVKPKRTYNRKCGFCNCKAEQSKMVRTNKSPNGWTCRKCRDDYIQRKKAERIASRYDEEYLNPVDEVYDAWIAEQAFCFD